MKVTFINRVYPPAQGATGQLLFDLASEMVRQGFDVTILTACPDRSCPRSEVMDGVRIERVQALPFTRASHWLRALTYLSLYPEFLWRALRLPPCDVLVTMTDPPLLLLLGPLIALLKGCRLVHWAQDLYPELAEELGVLRRRGWIANICRALSTAALRRQSAIVTVGRCMKNRLLARGLPESAIRIVPNWAPAAINSSETEAAAAIRQRHGLENKFVVMYSGNFGLAHSFDEILEAAQALQPKRPDVLFAMVGEGPRLARLKAKAAQLALSNLRFLPSQPLDDLSAVLIAADIHLITMLPQTCGLVVPSKLYGILAAGRPALFVGPPESEAALLIQEYQCGQVIGSAAELASAILSSVEHPQKLKAAGLRAKDAASAFTRTFAVTEFSRVLQHCIPPVVPLPLVRPSSVKAA